MSKIAKWSFVFCLVVCPTLAEARDFFKCISQGYNPNGEYIFSLAAMTLTDPAAKKSTYYTHSRRCAGVDSGGNGVNCDISEIEFESRSTWKATSDDNSCDELVTTKDSVNNYRLVKCVGKVGRANIQFNYSTESGKGALVHQFAGTSAMSRCRDEKPTPPNK